MNGATNFKRVKVLVIEDNNDHWMLIEEVIHTCFTEALTVRVASAERAIRLLEEYYLEEWEMPKLILLDLYLPTFEDGLRLLKQVKAMRLYRTVPIIALGASSTKSDITKAYECNASSYCLKPSSLSEWVTLFKSIRSYWLETATLPPQHYSVF